MSESNRAREVANQELRGRMREMFNGRELPPTLINSILSDFEKEVKAQDRKERGDVADGSGVVERLKKLAEKYEYFALEYDVGGWAIEVRDEVADLHLQTKDFPTIPEALEDAEKEVE